MTIERIFSEGRNPNRLERITANAKFNSENVYCAECNERRRKAKQDLFEQCPKCAVTVSQTKIGVCLQFQWQSDIKSNIDYKPIYCSVDLVPTFQIPSTDTRKLAESVNRAMLQEDSPRGWFKNLTNYTKCDLILDDVIGDVQERRMLNRVLLKILNADAGRYYYIRPGHPIGSEKFKSDYIKREYIFIKCLKKILDIDQVNLYMVKKLLMKPSVRFSSKALESIYLLPDLKRIFGEYIDLNSWEKDRELTNLCLPLKKL